MKKLVLSVMLALSLSTAFASVKEPRPIDDFMKTSEELSKLLNSTQSDGELDEEVLVKVIFTFNEDRKIVILNTYSQTENEQVNSFIKNVLDNKEILSGELEVGTNYSFIARFKQ